MSFKAILKVDGNEYRVLHCDYSMHQETDEYGSPTSAVKGGIVNVVIQSTDDTSFLQWMVDSYMKKNVTITFNKMDEDAKLKELELTDSYMVAFEEDFDSESDRPMTQSFSLSARTIKMGGAEHEAEWATVDSGAR